MFAEWNNDKDNDKTSVYKSASFREDSQYNVRQINETKLLSCELFSPKTKLIVPK